MTLTELEEKVPALKEYTKTMPPEIRSRCTVRTHAAGSIIHQKDMELNYFGIVAAGENRVINEFENGNVYMIEGNKAIDFIGEVTILAGMPRTSVTIEAVTDNVVAYISRRDAQQWLSGTRPLNSTVPPTPMGPSSFTRPPICCWITWCAMAGRTAWKAPVPQKP